MLTVLDRIAGPVRHRDDLEYADREEEAGESIDARARVQRSAQHVVESLEPARMLFSRKLLREPRDDEA